MSLECFPIYKVSGKWSEMSHLHFFKAIVFYIVQRYPPLKATWHSWIFLSFNLINTVWPGHFFWMSHKYNNIVYFCYNFAFEKCICTLFHQPHCCRLRRVQRSSWYTVALYAAYSAMFHILTPDTSTYLVLYLPLETWWEVSYDVCWFVDDITVLVILQQQAFNPVAFMLQ